MDLQTSSHPLSQRLRRGLDGPHARLTREENFASFRFGPTPPDDTALHQSWRRFVEREIGSLERTWDRLADDESREILLECLLFRILGWELVKRRRNSAEYQAFAKAIPDSSPRFPIIEPRFRAVRHKFINVHDLPELGMRLATTDGFFLCCIQNDQYHIVRDGETLGVEPGDVVLDCGGGWGDTAMLSTHRAGEAGRVFCFEFVPGNLEVVRRNLDLNPHLSDRVVLVPHPVYDRSEVEVRYDDWASGTRIGPAGEMTAVTVSIDDLVEREGLSSVDFIKMDIEGSEDAALRGAARTLEEYRPKLAISVYHKPEDLFSLADRIASIEPSYRFWLDHHTIHGEETVLYAKVAPA